MSRPSANKNPSPKRRSAPHRPIGPPPACCLARYAVVILWGDEDDCFVAKAPDLEFCSAFGDSPEEALSEIRVAMELWLEGADDLGQPPPEARFGSAAG